MFVLSDDSKRNHVFDELIETAGTEFAKTSGRLCRQAVSAMIVSVDCKLILQQNLGELCITTHVFAESMSDLDDSTNLLRANPLHAGYGKAVTYFRIGIAGAESYVLHSRLKWRCTDSSSPLHEVLQKREDEFLRDRIGQISFLIEALLSAGDHHFGLIDREHV